MKKKIKIFSIIKFIISLVNVLIFTYILPAFLVLTMFAFNTTNKIVSIIFSLCFVLLDLYIIVSSIISMTFLIKSLKNEDYQKDKISCVLLIISYIFIVVFYLLIELYFISILSFLILITLILNIILIKKLLK